MTTSRWIVIALVAAPVLAIVGFAVVTLRTERAAAPIVRVAGTQTRTIELPRHVVDAGYAGRLEIDRDGRYRLSLLAAIDRPKPSIQLRMIDHGMTDTPPKIEPAAPGTWLATGTLSMQGRWAFVIGDGGREVEFLVSWRP